MNVGTQRAKRSPSRTRARGKRVVAPRPAFDLDAITPMEAKSVSQLPVDAGWQFEPKWDGFRCLAWKSEDAADLRGKSGKSLARYFPEVLESLSELVPECFCIDAELVVPIRGELSFDALQMRLHPAQSRIRRLSQSTPALLIVFDCLWGADGTVLLDEPLDRRREALEHLFDEIRSAGLLRLSPYTRERREAQRWLERSGGALDGVIAKRIEEPYRPGERAMLKIKQHHTVDCVVGGFRYAANSKEVGSLLLGLYDDEGLLHHVGFTSSIVAAERRDLTRRLEALIEPPGFTGDAPGGPSRWNTGRSAQWEPLKPELVVEVLYDHVTAGRFRHGTRLLRWRPDKPPRQCKLDQIESGARSSALTKRVLA